MDDITDPGAKGFLFREGEALFLGFVVRRGETLTGFIDRCPHAGMPLAMAPDRYLTREGDLILCSSHGALFRTGDGVCVGGPCEGQALRGWPVTVESGFVLTG
jgi:nitrite reductase/ring-hydroxylating ferredoxin subunit